MTADDIVSALEGLRALVRDPVTGTYALRLDYNYFREYIEKWEAKKYVWLNPDGLLWTPYIMGRSNLAHLEHAPPLATIAPRDGEDEDDLEPGGVGDPSGAAPNGDLSNMVRINGDHVNGVDAEDQSAVYGRSILTPTTEIDNPTLLAQFSATSAHPVPGPPPTTLLTHGSSFAGGSFHSRGVDDESNGVYPASQRSVENMPLIPPTRFEIYPPLPGTNGRRKAGRPPVAGRRRTATPASLSRSTTDKRGGFDEIGGGGITTNGSGASLLKRSMRTTMLMAGQMDMDEMTMKAEDANVVPPPPPPPSPPQYIDTPGKNLMTSDAVPTIDEPANSHLQQMMEDVVLLATDHDNV